MADDDLGFLGNIKASLKESADLIGNINRIQDGIQQINRGFGETRERYQEFAKVVADSVSDITRLGGDFTSISDTIEKIGQGARRNVVASKESLLEIYATSQYLNTETDFLVERFAEAGIEFSNIAENLEGSIQYVQSLGLNAVTIMGDVTNRMDLMNRFNFEGGVMGFTKMAAQASMLRFDMQKTADFADKVLNPEGAIQMAAAFQRLGVASGDLVDPFILMDKAINDPAGLQDSLIDMTKQFTYFDEKTQSFRINPGGVRLMKELAETAGISYQEFSKTALAAADMDRRLSSINFDINAPEEDKMLIANMAKLGEDGRYYVELEDKGQVELGQLTQEEFGKLRKQYEDTPKTIEEVQRAQLDTLDLLQKDIAALPLRIGYAIAGQEGLTRAFETVRTRGGEIADRYLGDQGFASSEEFREKLQPMGDMLTEEIQKLIQGETTFAEINAKLGASLSDMDELFELRGESGARGGRGGRGGSPITTQSEVDIDGEIVIRVEAPTTLSQQQIDTIFNKPEIHEKIYEIVKSQADVAIREFKNN